jgi:hypothetical protein
MPMHHVHEHARNAAQPRMVKLRESGDVEAVESGTQGSVTPAW